MQRNPRLKQVQQARECFPERPHDANLSHGGADALNDPSAPLVPTGRAEPEDRTGTHEVV